MSVITNHFHLKSVSLYPAASIYPGRGGPGEYLFTRNTNVEQVLSDEEDFQVENEDDWMGDEDVPAKPSGPSRKQPSKFSESVAIEVRSIHCIQTH